MPVTCESNTAHTNQPRALPSRNHESDTNSLRALVADPTCLPRCVRMRVDQFDDMLLHGWSLLPFLSSMREGGRRLVAGVARFDDGGAAEGRGESHCGQQQQEAWQTIHRGFKSRACRASEDRAAVLRCDRLRAASQVAPRLSRLAAVSIRIALMEAAHSNRSDCARREQWGRPGPGRRAEPPATSSDTAQACSRPICSAARPQEPAGHRLHRSFIDRSYVIRMRCLLP